MLPHLKKFIILTHFNLKYHPVNVFRLQNWHSLFKFEQANLQTMRILNYFFFGAVLCLPFLHACKGQSKNEHKTKQKLIGGGCDGCELMYVGMPKLINAIDTSAGWTEDGQKLMITGLVLKLDGIIPAANVIIYYWQTNAKGYYSPKKEMAQKAIRHGQVRGWVKTDKNGKYTIYTIRPAAYPNRSEPAHIHISIKEPHIANEYYIDDLVFDDDELLLAKQKKKPSENRGGSGILRLLLKGKLQIAEHNIILGLNIPNYPTVTTIEKQSGLAVGEDQPSFIPYHAWGPDKGTRTCPVCKYGRYHGLVYYVGNFPNWNEIKQWLTFLEQESSKRNKYLKAYFVYGNENGYQREKREGELARIGEELNLKYLALTFVPSMNDKESDAYLNKINPRVENTFIIYRYRTIIAKLIDLKPSVKNYDKLTTIFNTTKGDFFNLSAPVYH